MSDWLKELPEQLRVAPFLAKAESVEDAMAKLQHAGKYMNEAIRIPSDEASDEARAEFFEKLTNVSGVLKMPDLGAEDGDAQLAAILAKLGAPAEADAYKLAEVEEWEWSDEQSKELKELAQKAGMTDRQFANFTKELGTIEQGREANANTAREKAMYDLQKEWGAAFDDRKAEIKNWLDAADAPAEVKELFAQDSIPAESLKWFQSVAAKFGGDATPASGDGGDNSEGKLTPSEADVKIGEIFNNPAYFDPSHPAHAALKKRMMAYQLMKVA